MSYPDQLVMHVPGVSQGDCWRACVAGLLGLEAFEVPHFAELGDEWWDASVAFVEETLPGLTLRGEYPPIFPFYAGAHPPVVILVGTSPRNVPHAVLADPVTGQIVHDPHPSRAGLLGEPDGVYALLDKL